ncbi:MAG: hypothetical protein ACRCZB_04895 [Bacteroidales bacterium]
MKNFSVRDTTGEPINIFYINVKEDFTDCLGGRTIKQGPYSGEAFKSILLVAFNTVILEKNPRIVVDFRGVFGIPHTFIRYSFSSIVKDFQHTKYRFIIKDIFTIVCDDQEQVEEVLEGINNDDF